MKGNISDRLIENKGGHLTEAVLIRLSQWSWSIRHLDNGSVYKEERFKKEESALSRWEELKKTYAGGRA
jgi:hypothetical protein